MYVRGSLGLIVLKLLSLKEQTGLSLIREIKKETGFWEPSAGSIYPLLQRLRINGLVRVRFDNRKKYYSLSSKGRIFLKGLENEKDKLVYRVIDGLKFYKTFSDKKREINYIISMLKELGNKKLDSVPEFIDLRKNLVKALSENSSPDKLKVILKEASEKLNGKKGEEDGVMQDL